MTQADALAMSRELICQDPRQARLLDMIFRRSGVERRQTVVPYHVAYQWKTLEGAAGRGPGTGDRMTLYQEHAPALALAACESALGANSDASDEERATVFSARESFPASEVTHLITVSCTGFSAPGLDWYLQESLALPASVERVQVGFMGCQGMINALRVARGLIAADPNAAVLVCAVELCSLHYRLDWYEEAMIGNALFADGASSTLVIGSAHRLADEEDAPVIVDSASIRIPMSTDQMSWRIGDYGFDMELTSKIPQSIQGHLHEWLCNWLVRHDLAVEDVSGWVVHPGGPRILDATERALGLNRSDLQASREVLSRYGNMSSPTVGFVLKRMLERDSVRRGPHVILAFGPGLVAEAVLLSV